MTPVAHLGSGTPAAAKLRAAIARDMLRHKSRELGQKIEESREADIPFMFREPGFTKEAEKEASLTFDIKVGSVSVNAAY